MKEPSGAETSSARTVQVLSVSPSEADHVALYNILQQPALDTDCGWVVHPVSSFASTAEALAEHAIPIVISEDNLHPGTWRTILDFISALPDPPLLIVASRLADERLWAEALNLGAWDVLAKPFDRQEVIRVVSSAWRHWRDRRELQTRQEGAGTGTSA
jgi:DNA-binding NtrC family response regulator